MAHGTSKNARLTFLRFLIDLSNVSLPLGTTRALQAQLALSDTSCVAHITSHPPSPGS